MRKKKGLTSKHLWVTGSKGLRGASCFKVFRTTKGVSGCTITKVHSAVIRAPSI